VLLLAGHPRRWLWPLVAFAAAAAAAFLPYLFSSPSGLWYVFQYHLERPLQIESVLGTPMLFGKLIGISQAAWGHSHGSHMLVANGAGFAATASGGLTLLAVAGVNIGALLAGTFIVEYLFAMDGLGYSIVQAVQQRDYLLVQGIALVVAIAYVVLQFIIDFLFTVVDPRVTRE